MYRNELAKLFKLINSPIETEILFVGFKGDFIIWAKGDDRRLPLIWQFPDSSDSLNLVR